VPTRTLRCPSDLRLSEITKLPKGMIIKSVGGDLYLGSLASLEAGVVFPNLVGGYLYLGSLTSLEAGVALPKSVGGYLYLGSLAGLENVPRKLRDKVRRS